MPLKAFLSSFDVNDRTFQSRRLLPRYAVYAFPRHPRILNVRVTRIFAKVNVFCQNIDA